MKQLNIVIEDKIRNYMSNLPIIMITGKGMACIPEKKTYVRIEPGPFESGGERTTTTAHCL